jgi:MYXO-CTERM domain-containing protein
MDGRCLFDACVGKTCPPGAYCDVNGACVDACDGAQCPHGQTCTEGECVHGGATSGNGSGGSGGSLFSVGGGDPTSSGLNGTTDDPVDSSGCGCRVERAQDGERMTPGALLLALTGLAMAMIRRKRRHTR